MNNVKRETMNVISDDYLRGLVEGEGCFTFCSVPNIKDPSRKLQIPTFVIEMHERDHVLIEKIREKLAPKNKIYNYKKLGLRTHTSKVYKRGHTSRVMVRSLGYLKNKVVPFFYNKLVGNKSVQFTAWLEKIGSNSNVPENYKILYRLYKSGYWERNPNSFY